MKTIISILLALSFVFIGQNSSTEAVTEQSGIIYQKEEKPVTTQIFSDNDIKDIAKVIYLEARGIKSNTEKACIVWTILNRSDYYGKSIGEVIREPKQFAFSETAPIWEELELIALDVLLRWQEEKSGAEQVGRVLPREYMWYEGNGKHNYFRNNYKKPFKVWNYDLESPYEEEI